MQAGHNLTGLLSARSGTFHSHVLSQRDTGIITSHDVVSTARPMYPYPTETAEHSRLFNVEVNLSSLVKDGEIGEVSGDIARKISASTQLLASAL